MSATYTFDVPSGLDSFASVSRDGDWGGCWGLSTILSVAWQSWCAMTRSRMWNMVVPGKDHLVETRT